MSRFPLACCSIPLLLGLACARVPAEPPTTPDTVETESEPPAASDEAPIAEVEAPATSEPEPEPEPEREPEREPEAAPEAAPEPPQEGPVVRANVRMESIEVEAGHLVLLSLPAHPDPEDEAVVAQYRQGGAGPRHLVGGAQG